MTGAEIKRELSDKNIYKEVEYTNYTLHKFGVTFVKKDDLATQQMCAVRNDSCIAITMLFSYNQLNDFISILNKKYVKISEYSWIDYSQVNIYWLIQKQKGFFALISSIEKQD